MVKFTGTYFFLCARPGCSNCTVRTTEKIGIPPFRIVPESWVNDPPNWYCTQACYELRDKFLARQAVPKVG